MTKMEKLIRNVGLVVALGIPASALADITYTYTGYGNNVSNTTQTQGGVSATVQGWADSGYSGDVGNKLYQGNVYAYSGGLGMQWKSPNGSSESLYAPEHTIDNCGNWTSYGCTANTPEDFVLFKFDSAVSLKSVGVGWWYQDSDLTILAYTGSGAPDLTKNTYSYTDAAGGSSVGLVNDGWSFIGDYYNVANNYSQTCNSSPCPTANVNPNGVTSSYWLVGAYNSRVTPGQTGDQNNDFFKICAITVGQPSGGQNPPPGAPEPGTMALLGLTVPMVAWSRRRKRGLTTRA